MTYRDVKQWLCLVIGCLLGSTAWAMPAQDLYTVQVPVPVCQSNVQSTALVRAYQMVMVRVSGNAHVNTIPEVYDQQAHAAYFVSRFSCATVPQQEASRVQITFDRGQVQKILRNAGQSLWLAHRPMIQVWMAVQQQGRIEVATDSDVLPLSQTMLDAAYGRGLRVSFPLMDLKDRSRATLLDVWQLRQQAVWRAAQRYGNEDVLMGKVFVDDSEDTPTVWRGIWLWRPNQADLSQVVSFQTDGNSAKQVAEAAMDWLADQLANEGGYLNEQGSAVTLTLHIDGVRNMDQYQAVLKDLRSRHVVKQLRVQVLHPRQLVLQVDVMGGQWALKQALSTQQRMVLLNVQDSATDVHYRWVSEAEPRTEPGGS